MTRTATRGLCVAALLLGGCVGRLETTPYRERTDSLGGALRGVTYSLPKVQYDVKMTRWLAECPGDQIDGKPTALKFAVDVEGTPRFVPGEAYEVYYDKLAGWLRTSSFEIKYWPNGNLKSIGAGAEDKSADVIKDVAKTALAVASATAGVPPIKTYSAVAPLPPPPPDPVILKHDGVVCTATAFQDVRKARDATGEIKSASDELTRLASEIQRMKDRATLKLINKTDRETLLQLFQDVDNQNNKVALAKERLAALKSKLGVSDSFVWDSALDKAADNQLSAYSLTEEQKAKLLALLAIGQVPPLRGEAAEADAQRRAIFPACFSDGKLSCVESQVELRAVAQLQDALEPCGDDTLPASECLSTTDEDDARYRAARDGTADSGIFVREPVQARLLFCRVAYDKCSASRDEAKLAAGPFPQLGQLRYLPLRVGTFQAREMALSLTEQGQVESFSYKSTKAPAQVLAATMADVASQIDNALEKRETERRDDLKYAREQETAEVQSEINRLTKDLELKKLEDQADEDPLQTLKDDTAALEAQLANLKARKAVLDAEKALNPTPTDDDDA